MRAEAPRAPHTQPPQGRGSRGLSKALTHLGTGWEKPKSQWLEPGTRGVSEPQEALQGPKLLPCCDPRKAESRNPGQKLWVARLPELLGGTPRWDTGE